METLPVPHQGDNSTANPNSVKSDDSSPQHESGRGSPPPNCAICLGTCRNKSFTDSCLHQFCFKCLLTWSKVKAVCPLCKQNFKSIIHNVRSNHQYEEYMVEQRHTEEIADRIDFDTHLANATRRFRYRTTLTLPRRESIAIQQLLLQYPLMADVMPQPAHSAPPRRRRSPTSFRRTVYRHNLWARTLPDFTGRYRDCTPEFYRYNYAQTQRLVPWLNRELSYLLNENVGHISYVMARILELLPQYHITSPEFRDAVQRYFGDRTEHFLHELYCFASTPYDMTGYDRNVQYTTDTRISTMINEVISSSESDASVDSDIVMVSSSEPAEPPPGPSRIPVPVYPQNYIPQPPAESVIPIETISHSDTDDDSSEVMVVGYIKPPQERTPEIVDLLGSDSDVIVQENVPTEEAHSNEIQEARPAQPLVKVSLKRHLPTERQDSESETSTYTPPRPRPRKRRPRSDTSFTTTDSCRDTSSPDTTLSSSSDFTTSSSYQRSSFIASDTESFTSSFSTSSDDRRKRSSRKKSRRKVKPKQKTKADKDNKTKTDKDNKTKTDKDNKTKSDKDNKRSKKRTRSHHKDKKSVSATRGEKEKRSKHKSHSGKGVKSSKKTEETAASQEGQRLTDTAIDQPSTSGISNSRHSCHSSKKKRRVSRDNKRLKSVVNVMNGKTSTNDASSSANSNLLDILSSAILNPRSAYNSDSGSLPGDERTSNVTPEILVKAESCFKVELPNPSYSDNTFDPEDELPLNLTMKRSDSFSS